MPVGTGYLGGVRWVNTPRLPRGSPPERSDHPHTAAATASLSPSPGSVRPMADFPGITHVALTVSDLDRSAAWYAALFGAKPDKLDDGEAYRAAVWVLGGGTVVALHQFNSPLTETFDEFRPGLDHLAFGCADRSVLAAWVHRLDALGIKHGDICDEPYGSGLSFRDPDNIALEFFAPPPQ